MSKERLPNHILDDWNIDAKAVPHPIDTDGLDVRGLKIEGLLDDSSEVVARTVHITPDEVLAENTEERASMLRTLAADVLGRCLSLSGEFFEDVELVLAELIQNAQRYSISGPVWVSVVQTVLTPDECVLDLTVASDQDVDPTPYRYPDHDIVVGNELDGVDVHGRGSVIVEALSFQHGRFVADRMVGAYALMRCTAEHDQAGGYKEVA